MNEMQLQASADAAQRQTIRQQAERIRTLEAALHEIASDHCAPGEGAVALVGRMKIRAFAALKSSGS